MVGLPSNICSEIRITRHQTIGIATWTCKHAVETQQDHHRKSFRIDQFVSKWTYRKVRFWGVCLFNWTHCPLYFSKMNQPPETHHSLGPIWNILFFYNWPHVEWFDTRTGPLTLIRAPPSLRPTLFSSFLSYPHYGTHSSAGCLLLHLLDLDSLTNQLTVAQRDKHFTTMLDDPLITIRNCWKR